MPTIVGQRSRQTHVVAAAPVVIVLRRIANRRVHRLEHIADAVLQRRLIRSVREVVVALPLGHNTGLDDPARERLNLALAAEIEGRIPLGGLIDKARERVLVFVFVLVFVLVFVGEFGRSRNTIFNQTIDTFDTGSLGLAIRAEPGLALAVGLREHIDSLRSAGLECG